jgi:hypothetical protein
MFLEREYVDRIEFNLENDAIIDKVVVIEPANRRSESRADHQPPQTPRREFHPQT